MSAPAVSAADVHGIASQVWRALLGDAVLPGPVPPEPMAADAVRAWVSVEGPWRGRVELVCARSTAEAMTAVVLGVDDGERVAGEDVEDVLGELANVVGGAVKSLLPGSAALGLPGVEAGPAHREGRHDRAPAVLHVDLVWRDQPVEVALRAPAPTEAS